MSFNTFYLNSELSSGVIDGSNVIIGGNLGISINNPQHSLDVSGTINTINLIASTATISELDISGETIKATSIQTKVESTEVVILDVNVSSKTSSAFNSSGSSNAYFINNIETPFIHFTSGKTYRFNQGDTTNSSHPIRFYLDEAKTSQYSSGITVNGNANAGNAGDNVEITITSSTPQILYYQCQNHSFMGGKIYVKGTNITSITSVGTLTEGTWNASTIQKQYLDTQNISVNDLSDVSFNSTSTTNGQALVWNSTDNIWEPGTVASSGGGGLTDLSATSINDLSDVSFNSTSTTNGQALVWNSTNKIWEAGTVASSGVKKPTMTIPETSSGNILLNFTEPIKDQATYDKDDFVLTNEGTVIAPDTISVENDKVKFGFNPSTHTVSTVAGLYGTHGYVDATGSNARFSGFIDGLTVVGTDVYISDNTNYRIRKMTSAGVVTTIAGQNVTSSSAYADGVGTAAIIPHPEGMCNDGTNIYFISGLSCTVRKLVISTGAVTTIAGSQYAQGSTDATGTAARFFYPKDITIDSTHTNLYITDKANNKIRKLVIATGVVTTLASATACWGIAIDSTDTNLYVSSWTGKCIFKIVIATGVVTTLFTFDDRLQGMVIDSNDEYLYVATYQSHIILRVKVSDGTYIIYAGQEDTLGDTDGTLAESRFKVPWALAIDANDNMYVAGRNSYTIRKLTARGAVTITDVQNLTVTYTKSATANKNLIGTSPSSVAVDSFDFIGTNRIQTPITGTLDLDTISEKTSGSGVTIDSVLLKDQNVTAHTISAQNYAVGGTNFISASRQGNFRDLEVKNSSNNHTILLTGDGGNISIDGTLSTDTISEKTSATGVTIDSVLLKDNIVTAHTITAQNYSVGGTNFISASRQGNFRDLEVKNSGNTETILLTGDGGHISINGTLSTDTISEKTDASGVTIDGVLLKDGSITATGTTQSAGNNTTQLATTAFVSTAVSNLVNGAPGALDTLGELAAALDASANFATNVTNTLGSLQTQINNKQATLTFNAPSSNNTNPSTSAQIKTALDAKQDTLTAGTNITINGTTISASGGGGGGNISTSSINDLSDVSFNSTSTTNGQSLVWDSTNKIWEAGTVDSSQWTTSSSDIYYNSGKVGIGKTSPSSELDVSGNGIFSGTVTASGSILSSDDRVKHNEQPIINALSTISKINPKHYFKTNKLYDASHNFTLNDNGIPISTSGTTLKVNKDYTIETGIIAQDLINISELEFAVMKTNPLGIDYNSIHCTHIAATNELHQIVKTQQTEIQTQQQEIETLKLFNIDSNNQINELKQELQNIKQHLGI